ncbi:MAG: ABC transporter ATP-binding protein [Dehalococcoidia bacterium]
MDELAVEVQGLRKAYGPVEAVRGIDLEVRRGEIFALIGPNGAGKTTTLEILEGHRLADAGIVRVLGEDPGRRTISLKQRIGIVLQSTSIQPYLTVEETIELFRGYYPRPLPLDELIEIVGLGESRRKLVRRLSGGQQRRLDVAMGLAGDPELLFLDEPTTGFDPAARRGAWEMIRGLKSLGKTVLLTTHYMEEAQSLADRVSIISQGRIVASGTPDDLRRGEDETVISFRYDGNGDLPAVMQNAVSDTGRLVLRTTEPTAALYELTRWATERGTELEGLSVTQVSLEDVYLELAGQSTEDAG